MDLFEFEWWRCVSGYRLDGNVIRPKSSRHDRLERYQPLEVSALFAKFARLPGTAEGMLRFCNEYGLPGSGTGSGATPGVRFFRPGETVDAILGHHRAIRRALKRFEAGDVSDLERACNGEGLATLRVQMRRRADGSPGVVFRPPDLIRAMWFQLLRHACSGGRLFSCDKCMEPFEVGSGTGRRASSAYCSPKCRRAAFTDRLARRKPK